MALKLKKANPLSISKSFADSSNSPPRVLKLPISNANIKTSVSVIYSAQYLRFIAAALVVLVHAFEVVPSIGNGNLGTHFGLGASGVDIFFILSGFIMCVITQSRESTPKDFLLHRLVRVAPPYWAITALMAGLVFFAPKLFNSSEFVIPHIVSSFLFFGWPHPVMQDSMPIYFPGWTLQYEAFFYLIFACSLGYALRKKVAVVSTVILSLVSLGLIFQPESEILKFYTKPIMLEFIFGMLIGAAFIQDKNIKTFACIALIFSSIGLLVIGALYWPVARLATERFLVWGIPAAMLVLGSVFLEKNGHVRKNAFFKLLGDASYATYLVHFFVIGALEKILHMIHPNKFQNDIFIIIPCFIASWTAGIVFHFMFEKPVVNYLGKAVLK